jgi:LCP family protein required for cell wall assembly
MKGIKKFAIAISIILIGGLLAAYAYSYFQLSKIKKVQVPKSNEELKISPVAAKEDKNIINIAFFGLDRRYENDPSRSDAIMIVTIDEKHKKIKISSIMRDSYVNIDGHGMTKINHAYAYGGPTLAIQTLNKNFNLNVKDYVAIDFAGLEKIIDSIGGVDIEVREDEIPTINYYIKGISERENKAPTYVTKTGYQNLNGMQAVSYARVRYTAGGDEERTQRQRTVLIKVLEKIRAVNATSIPNIVAEFLPYTETSMSNAGIIKTATSVYSLDINNIEQKMFPKAGIGRIINGVWYLIFDLEETKIEMHKFIYEQ